MKTEKKPAAVKVTFTEGWEERFTQAAYNLYLEIEKKKAKERLERSA